MFVLQLAATLFMAGLIWFVQIVHYPLGASVSPDHYRGYQRAHMRLTTPVVAIPMLIEAGSALWWFLAPNPRLGWQLPLAGMLLLCVIWTSTGLLLVPAHNRLLGGFQAGTHRYLVRCNWIRTIAWTLRSLLLCGIAWTLLEAP